MAEVVRREDGHTGCGAGPADRCAQAIRRDILEHAPIRVAIVPRAKLSHGRKEHRRYVHPTAAARLGDRLGDAPAPTRLV